MESGLREISYVDAGVEALREEMARDESIVYIGQGIGPRGGNFRQTRGLWQQFGDHRLRDTGISELGATGVGIGAAMAGSRAIVDEVFLDFTLEAMTQIVQQAATAHYCSNGKLRVPLVIRGAMGAIRNAGAHHSHTFYAWFGHIPGLKVATPATPYDVKGLMKTAIRDDGPVLFIEHKALYNTKGPVPEAEYLIPFGQARVVRQGSDVTVVAVSRMVSLAEQAAEALAAEGVSLEIIDPRTVVPLDRETIAESVSKTGRLAVVDEAPEPYGFSGEVCAVVCEHCFGRLKAAPLRLCSEPVPNAFSPALEGRMIPSVDRIVSGIRALVLSSRSQTCRTQ